MPALINDKKVEKEGVDPKLDSDVEGVNKIK